MTIDQMHELRQQIDVLIQKVSSDPACEHCNAYDRHMEKVLSRLQESRAWSQNAINILESEQSENSKMYSTSDRHILI